MADIQNLNESWEGHSGQEVETFVKGKLQQQVNGIVVNGVSRQKDLNGNVNLTIPEVDASLNTESTNPVENGVVATEINAIKSKTIGNMYTQDAGDGENLNLIIENENGSQVASCRIPKASEGGDQTYARVSLSLSKNRIKKGDSVVLNWTYNNVNSDGTPTGRVAETVTIRAVNGTTETFRQVLQNVSDGATGQLTLGEDVLPAGTIGVYVIAVAMLDDGTEQRAQAYKTVSVVTMSLISSFDPSSQLALNNGYLDGSTVDVPFVFTGPKGTAVTMWLDGQQYDTKTISTSTASTGHFYIDATELAAGRHNIQIVAESDGLLSNVLYFDFLKAGSNTPYIGLRITLSADSLNELPLGFSGGVEQNALPISAVQYEELAFEFAAWNADSVSTSVIVAVDGVTRQTITADRSLQNYAERFDASGNVILSLTAGSVTRSLALAINTASGVDVAETSDYYIKLSATGRSNNESAATRSNWGDITTFKGVDWKTNGWDTKDGCPVLKLTNGAKAIIGYKPFELTNQYSVSGNGMTVEMEIMVSQVLERGAQIVSCLSPKLNGTSDLGFGVTTEKAGIFLGEIQHIPTAEEDEYGEQLVIDRVLGVENNIAPDRWMKIAFVMQSNADGRKMMLYINGVLSKANRYDTGTNLIQQVAQSITFDSSKADVYIRSVRIYRRALTDTELLSNFIVDRPTASEIRDKYDDNNVLTEQGTLDMNTIINRGRGVLVIIRSEDSGTGLTDVFARNDKKADFVADYIHWYSPLGRANDFEAYNVYIRIQGTSSTKYPWKNVRIYLNKGPKTAEKPLRLLIGGVETSSLKYALRGSANSIAQSVLCAKTDFVDSSLVLNTGGARLFHDTMVSLNLLTPPQQYDRRIRQAVDGIPCDMFCGTDINGTLTYYGQFNLNNEKSKSGGIFGMESVKDSQGSSVNWDCPIALEALDNGSPMTLFQSAGSSSSASLETQLEAEFDKGFEFNYPEDTFWSSTKISDPSKESVASSAQKTAIKRLLGWLYDVTPSAMRSNPDYGTRSGWSAESKAKWVSSRFKNEASSYFDINHLLTYYLFTDYWASVDQRAKNILWRTWDGLKWYSTFYDGDTAMSIRNDAFMVYLYNVTRDTWDDERRKYAFEGHDSRLWCLVLANFETELRQCATNLRSVLSTVRMLQMFNGEIQGNWCERQYNMSQILKYIQTMDTLNYVYTLTGNREAHRTAFLTDRGELLDARYATSAFQSDNVDIVIARTSSDAVSKLTVKSGDLYYFGYGTNNNALLFGPVEAFAGDTVEMQFSQTMQASDPARVYGASRMTEIDFSQMLGQVSGSLNLGKCVMLSKLLMPLSVSPNLGVQLNFGSIAKIEYIDLTGQTSTGTNSAGTVLDVSGQSRLNTLLAGGTALTNIVLPEGAPITTLVLPSTLTRLSLRYLPELTENGLTLQGTANVSHFSFAECPKLDWQELIAQCPNVAYLRIEGVNGKVRPEFLERYMNLGGINASGIETTYPVMTGKVTLTTVVTAERLAALRAKYTPGGLDIEECQFSQYIFDDLVTDPANITNEDNQTGLDYLDDSIVDMDDQPNKYRASGHVQLIHDKCQLVAGRINNRTGKMNVTKLSKDSLFETADGGSFNPTDPNGEGFDVFLYLPRYWYKGVNEYKKARKHFFVSSKQQCPESTATITRRYLLSEILFMEGKAIDKQVVSVGDTLDNASFTTATECSVFRVEVSGMKQVRFPSMNHSYFSHVFADEEDTVIAIANLQMSDVSSNPADFMNDEGDYDFRDVPDGAKYCYFTCRNAAGRNLEAIVTDSPEVEAIEPDWVEHKPELIGVYQGFAAGVTTGGTATSGLRSISGKVVSRGNNTATTNTAWQYDNNGNPTNLPTSKLNGTAQDFFNLASYRNVQTGVVNGEYSTVPYETSKDMANLLMAWFGTRDIETIVGRGTSAGETTGVRNAIAFGDSSYYAQNQHNKMWGLECWTGSTYEWTDKGCLNAPSFAAFKKAKRPVNSSYVSDKYYNILQQDGTERRVRAAYDGNKWQNNVARVRFGRYCDIVVGSYAGDTSYVTCYAAYQSTHADKGRVLGRSANSANAGAGVACSSTYYASSYSGTSSGARLCFFGEIENESELL